MNALQIVQPMALTDAMLIATNVTEADYAAYAAGTTYGDGDRVIVVATHKVYESLQPSNVGHDPTLAASATWWIEVSPTNRWKAFDGSNSSQTARSTSITYQIRPGVAITSVAMLNLTGATSVRIRLVDGVYGTVYDKTTDLSALPSSPSWWAWTFGARVAPSLSVATDLPSIPTADLYIDLAGGTDLAVGVILFGQMRAIGLGVQHGARLGIQDYSRKETNDYGDTVLVQRAFAKRANFDIPVEKLEVDRTATYLASLRATPCLWIGSAQYESTVIYGFFKDFEVTIAYATMSDCSLQIEGLT